MQLRTLECQSKAFFIKAFVYLIVLTMVSSLPSSSPLLASISEDCTVAVLNSDLSEV